LHHIGIAAIAYSDDWNGHFPAITLTLSDNAEWRWAGNLTDNTGDGLTNRLLNSYLQIARTAASSPAPDIASVTRCPSDHFQGLSQYQSQGTSYFYNSRGEGLFATRHEGLDGADCTVERVVNPSRVVMAADYSIYYVYAIAGSIANDPTWKG